MRWTTSNTNLIFAALVGAGNVGCPSGGVGDPCIPEDEYRPNFSGFSHLEVNVESKSFQCETRVCIAAYFKGRVSCPYVNELGGVPGRQCYIPGTFDPASAGAGAIPITAPVEPQFIARPREDAVYCSCRCSGPDKNARYCECPSGYKCENIVPAGLAKGQAELSGGYCVKEKTLYPGGPGAIPTNPCALGPDGKPITGCPPEEHPAI